MTKQERWAKYPNFLRSYEIGYQFPYRQNRHKGLSLDARF